MTTPIDNSSSADTEDFTILAEDGKLTLTAGDVHVGKRLDIVLANSLQELSRSRLKQLILEGEVRVNAEVNMVPKFKLTSGDIVEVNLPEPVPAEPIAQNIPLDILFEDEDLLVLNKPVGMVVHPAPGAPDGTLVNALLYHCPDQLSGIGGVKRPGIVHRLDKNTSGVMVVAKNEVAHNHLAAQFADHGRTGPLTRSYTAYAWGLHTSFAGTIDAPIGRDRHNRQKQAINKDGKYAITHYQTLQRFVGEGWQISKIQCRLETGRTHQIRVHMAHIGHPIVSDPTYASGFATKANALPSDLKSAVQGLHRQALHATELGFVHPSNGEMLTFEAPLPDDMAKLDNQLQPFAQNLTA